MMVLYTYQRLISILRVGVLLACLSGLAGARLHAQTTHIAFLGEKIKHRLPGEEESTDYLNLFRTLVWNVTIEDKDGKITQLQTHQPDTIKFHDRFTKAHLTAAFTVPQALTGQILALHYVLSGWLSVKLNGEELVATGQFVKGQKISAGLNQSSYKYFNLKDTFNTIDVSYIGNPRLKVLKLSLEMGSLNWAETGREDHAHDSTTSFAFGFYYLSFGIIFIIFFFFFREKTENLYFSLFCLSVALSFIWGDVKLGQMEDPSALLNELSFIALSFEFLSIFFFKVLKNKEKSKIPLLIILSLMAATFLPVFGNVSFNFNSSQPALLLLLVVLFLLVVYSATSCLNRLIRGISEKRWEARTIVMICSAGILVFWLLPVVLGMTGPFNDAIEAMLPDYSDYMFNIGLCIYPLPPAIVLGRRNALNQKQLITQIDSIKKLSDENLEKEKEKKQILESQNTELERKVEERTLEVRQQKELIEVKNKSITDNLIYAQRIQSAILPDIKLVHEAFAQSFILYLPKDIVSGDFYAFAESQGRALIIAGDCTGHGVSGAFMSMIGGSLLNQIINEKGTGDPAMILSALNAAVIETFRQGENESNDGMDVSVCSFCRSSNQLLYAGANRPLWLIRNNDLLVYKPDKFPIGGLQMARERQFTNYTIGLQPGDSLYIFTDGYADQFGGPRGKKMMTAKFREMLLSIQTMDMAEQGAYLNTYFNDWRGDNEQVDDVLVIGIRV